MGRSRTVLQRIILLSTLVLCGASTASAQTYNTYALDQPRGCYGRVPVSPITQVPKAQLVWTGKCENGYAEGRGELLSYRNGTLVSRSIGRRIQGLEEGPLVIIDTDPNSSERGVQTFMNATGGFPVGKVQHISSSGIVLAEGEGDGRGGFRQTSNPLSPLLSLFGQAVQDNKYVNSAKLFIQIFAPEAGVSAGTCFGLLKALSYTDQAIQYWCTAFPLR